MLPTNSTERLLAIADRIEFAPSSHDQSSWFCPAGIEDGETIPATLDLAGRGDFFEEAFDCGTTACIAGWAVLLSPREQVLPLLEEYRQGWIERRRMLSFQDPESVTQAEHIQEIEYPATRLLDFNRDLANRVFYIMDSNRAMPHLPEILRRLAKVDDRTRTVDDLHQIYAELGVEEPTP